MSGGLIQLVISGKEDSSLTHNPEITFFKKVYKRHTNFSLEIKEIYSDQQANYGEIISFTLDNADMVHRCFIQIDLPTLAFNDQSITDTNYLNWKVNTLSRLNNQIQKWNTLYTNFSNLISIELILYQQIQQLFLADNLSLNSIKDTVIRFNNTYKNQLETYSNLVNESIYTQINMSSYLLNINKLLCYTDILPNNNYISLNTIIANINNQYKLIYQYLNYYNSNLLIAQNNYNTLNSNNINFAYNQYLGNFYFTNFDLEIGGQVVEQYSADQFHIYQYHHLSEDQQNNYNQMIGHVPELYNFNNIIKPSKKLLIPLNFWFCRKAGTSLPLVAMRNTSVNINLTINKLKNLIYFVDYETEYNNLLKLTILKLDTDIKPNTDLNYTNYTYDVNSQNITYYLSNINYTALSLIYTSLKTDDINYILNTYGTNENNNNVMYLNNWIYFKNDLINNPTLMNKIGGYENYIDYNYLLNFVPNPNITLLCENIYLDDVERNKFASSKLEYVIETFNENIFDIPNIATFDGNLSLDKPCKYLKWFIQPKTFLLGLSNYSKVTPYLFDYSNYFKNNFFISQNIYLNQVELLNVYLNPSFYSYVLGYKTLNRILPNGVYYYNFALFPEDTNPSGTANLSIISEKKIRFIMDPLFLNEYFTSKLNLAQLGLQAKVLTLHYNLFVVHQGIGRLVFIQ
jgi:hypothetical protein